MASRAGNGSPAPRARPRYEGSGRALDAGSPERRRILGQNFFRSIDSARQFASQLAAPERATVVEVGAGSGMVARALAETGRPIVAVEIDKYWARRLQEERLPGVTVVVADFLRWPPPPGPVAVIGNLPFGSSTDILRRCLELSPQLLCRGVFLLQQQYVQKRIGGWGGNLFNAEWAPWYRFRAGLGFPRRQFRPVPNADTQTLLVEPQDPSLLAWAARGAYQDLARAVFTTGHLTVGAALQSIEAHAWGAWLWRSGLDRDRRVKDLSVEDWLELFRSRRSDTAAPRPRRPQGDPDRSARRGGPGS
ncbi:MAG: 23S ribosomal RNA methyltransferase Erm [Egibacteraceae bacterium]